MHEAQALLEYAKAASDRARREAIGKFDAGPGRKLRAAVAARQAALEEARRSGTAQQRLEASSAFVKAKAALDKALAAAVDQDPAVLATAAEQRRAEKEQERVAQVAARIAANRRADEARREADRARLRQKIKYFGVGVVGVLGAVQISQVVDDKNMIVRCQAANLEYETIWVSGISTDGMVDGKYYSIESTIEITGTRKYETVLGASRTVFEAKPYRPPPED